MANRRPLPHDPAWRPPAPRLVPEIRPQVPLRDRDVSPIDHIKELLKYKCNPNELKAIKDADEENRTLLKGYVHKQELVIFPLPADIQTEVPEVQRLIKGLNTIWNNIGCHRRSYLVLVLRKKENEGESILKDIRALESDAQNLVGQIRSLRGRVPEAPAVLQKPLKLLKLLKAVQKKEKKRHLKKKK